MLDTSNFIKMQIACVELLLPSELHVGVMLCVNGAAVTKGLVIQ
jgi:hypothetical protein